MSVRVGVFVMLYLTNYTAVACWTGYVDTRYYDPFLCVRFTSNGPAVCEIQHHKNANSYRHIFEQNCWYERLVKKFCLISRRCKKLLSSNFQIMKYSPLLVCARVSAHQLSACCRYTTFRVEIHGFSMYQALVILLVFARKKSYNKILCQHSDLSSAQIRRGIRLSHSKSDCVI